MSPSLCRAIVMLCAAAPLLATTAARAEDPRALAAGTHHLTVTRAGDTDFSVFDNGRLILHDKVDEGVWLRGPYTGQGHTYVLLVEWPGGNVCEMLFRAVDLDASPPAFSPQFGNCGDKTTASVRGGILQVTVAPTVSTLASGSKPVAGEIITFGNGHYTHKG